MGRIIDRGTGIVVEPGDPDEPDPNTIIIPTLRAYIVINDASLTRVSNNLALPATGFSISIDSDSAHWTWSASLPLRAKGDLEPNAPDELVELEAMANGAIWRLLIESIREDERFGAGSLRIGGRGIAAVLSDPSAPAVARDNFGAGMTAQQIAMDALSINGTPLGWTLDWQIADWLIPAGVWAHTGTAMEAVVRLAEVAGGYVQAAPATQSLRVMPRYPVAPWEWATAAPAVILPAAAVLERGAQHIVKPAYNAVHVAGQGARGRVVRVGSVGDRPARVIVDDLATHLDAIRGRGISVLGDTGAQQVTTLETGILPASGVIHVGTLMDWTRGAVARRGIVRGLSVTVSVPGLTSNAPLIVRQALEVECHG
ncbi:MAG: hypothetical protein J0L85_05780 [Zoogloea sp.]|nr:hypothetical protein [Zoogloea sp.]MCA0187048.1 hypothetical protein [Pseudomonadota bacterium]